LKSRRTSPTGDERHNKRKSDRTSVDSLKESQLAADRDLLHRVGHHRRARSQQQALRARVRAADRRQAARRDRNRQLNTAIHRIALTRARCHPETQDYLARKRAEGKTGLEATRCLKRRIWHLLQPPTPVLETTRTTPIP